MADPSQYRPPGEEDDDDEEIDETAYKHAKDAVLFAIDVSSSMLKKGSNSTDTKSSNDSPASAALKSAYTLMQQRVISSPNDVLGILLYGTEETKFLSNEGGSSLSYPYCYLLTDLGVPSAEDVKALRNLVEDEEEWNRLMVPSSERVTLSNVLFAANQIFATKAPNFASRRLFIVTDQDDPHADDPAQKSAAAVRAKDLYDLGVIIELFPISAPDHEFDRTKFYNDIVYSLSPTDPEAPAPISGGVSKTLSSDGITLLQSLLSAINSKAVPRRALFSALPFELGPKFQISVKGYIMFKRQTKRSSCYVWLGGERPKIATGTIKAPKDSTTVAVDKADIRKGFKFGGEYITFTAEENTALRQFGDPVIRLIGFKPASMIPFWANIKPATFLYPTEELFVGSTRVFSALHHKMTASNLVALVWFIARRNATPSLAALFPSSESLDPDTGTQITPAGLWLHVLPFADDVRQNPETELVRAPESLTDKMRDVVQQLQLPKARYDPGKYPNPALQRHYQILQAMALEEDLPDKEPDKTLPKYKQIHKRAGEYVVEWGKELDRAFESHRHSHGATSHAGGIAKRANDHDDSNLPSRAKKRLKEAESASSDESMRRAFDKPGALAKLTATTLKEWLAAKGLSTAGNKPALVERVEEYFERKS